MHTTRRGRQGRHAPAAAADPTLVWQCPRLVGDSLEEPRQAGMVTANSRQMSAPCHAGRRGIPSFSMRYINESREILGVMPRSASLQP
jgi:hypothetical protein